MSKAARNRAAYNEKQQAKREREELAAKNAKIRKVTAIVTVSVIAALIVAFIVGICVYNIRMNSGDYLRKETAASSNNIDVDGAMMNYYYNDVLNSFVAYYGSYVQYYGFDPSADPKYQTFSDGQTWFDYFMSGAKTNVTGYLALNEGAMAEGISLTDAEKSALETRVSNIDAALYGRGVKKNDILNAKLIEALAYKYQAAKQAGFTPTSSEIAARYKESPEKFQSVDYIAYTFDWSGEKMTQSAAKIAAARLSDAKSVDGFKSVVAELYRSDSPDLTDEQIETAISNITTTGASYTDGSELSEWAFSAKVGDTKVIEDESKSTTTAYILTKAANRDESATVNVRHILFTADKYGSTEKAKAQAEKVLAEFNSGDKSIESFSNLVLAYTEDENTCYNGGLYQNLASGLTLTNFDEWCFFGTRQPGDCEIIETTHGIHIVYFESKGLVNWEASVADAIISEKFTELDKKLLEDYPVSFDDILIAEIPG